MAISSNLHLRSKLIKVGEIVYTFNGRRGVQIKPIVVDEQENKWVGKEFSQWSFSNEYIASQISQILDLPGFKFPTIRFSEFEDKPWQWSNYIDIKYDYGRDSEFYYLNDDERQVAVLYRLVANVDGNFRNFVKNSKGQMWVFDFEYAGKFDKFDDIIFHDKMQGYKVLNLLMRPNPLDLQKFQNGIHRVNEEYQKGSLSLQNLERIIFDSGLNVEQVDYYAKGISEAIKSIEKNLQLMISQWNTIRKEIYQ